MYTAVHFPVTEHALPQLFCNRSDMTTYTRSFSTRLLMNFNKYISWTDRNDLKASFSNHGKENKKYMKDDMRKMTHKTDDILETQRYFDGKVIHGHRDHT